MNIKLDRTSDSPISQLEEGMIRLEDENDVFTILRRGDCQSD